MAAQPQNTVAYVSLTRCVNCRRFLEILESLPAAARRSVTVIDIDVTAPPQGLEFVPTVITPEAHVLVGVKAFDFLNGFHRDVPLDSYLESLNNDLGEFVPLP